MRCSEKNVITRDATSVLDVLPNAQDRFTLDNQRIQTDEGDSIRPVIEHNRAYLARIVDALAELLAVVAHHFHADLGRHISLGKTGSESGANRRRGLCESHAHRFARKEQDDDYNG